MSEVKFLFPDGYNWLVKKNIVGFEPFTQLEPWYFLNYEDRFWVNKKWPLSKKNLFLVFARRQDDDTLACLNFSTDGNCINVVQIHGWTDEGYTTLNEFDTIWAWLKNVILDIEVCVQRHCQIKK